MDRNLLAIFCIVAVVFAGILVYDNSSKTNTNFYKICNNNNLSECNHNHNYTFVLQNPNDTLIIHNADEKPRYNVNYVIVEAGNGIVYKLPCLIKTSLLKTHCNFVGTIDPYLKCNDSLSTGTFDGIAIQRQQQHTKVVVVGIETIKLAIRKEWNNTDLRARYSFILAQTYYNNQDYKNALEWYTKCVELKGRNQQQMFYSQYRIGLCQLNLFNNTKDAKESFIKAFSMDPHRKEPLYYLARIARIEKEYSLCLLYSGSAMQVGIPWTDALFVEGNIYNWQLQIEHALCQYYTGRKKAAKRYWKNLLETQKDAMPENIKNQIIKNLKF